MYVLKEKKVTKLIAGLPGHTRRSWENVREKINLSQEKSGYFYLESVLEKCQIFQTLYFKNFYININK